MGGWVVSRRYNSGDITELVVESIVSTYENRQSKVRTLTEDRANYEMLIGVNGPNLTSAENLLNSALNKYFQKHKQGKWHFTMDPKRLEYTVSKSIDKKLSTQSKLPFMNI